MKMTHLLGVLGLIAVSSCGGPQTPAPEPAARAEDKASPADTDRVTGQLAAPSTDLSSEIILTGVLESGDAILDQMVAYIQPHLPGPLQGMVQPAALRAQFFKALGAPQLEAAIQTDRPVAFAMADPEVHRGGGRLGPMLLAVPVKDAQLLIDELGKLADRHERTPWNDHLLTFEGDTLRLRFVEDYLLAAAHEKLLNGAAGTLLPLVRSASDGGARGRLQLAMGTIYRRYGAEIERGITKMRRKVDRKAAHLAAVARMVARWMGYLGSIRDITLAARLEPAAIQANLDVAAQGKGAFPAFLAQQNPGPAWGAGYLPAESALAYVTRQSPDAMLESIDEGLEMLKGLLATVVQQETLQKAREAARESVKHFTGESAGAAWVTTDGGLGLASVSRVRDADAARAAMLQLLGLLADEVNRLMAKALPPKVQKELQGFKLTLRVRKGALALAGVRGDLVDVNLRWPRLKDPEQRKQLAKLRKGLTRVLGPRIALALVTTGDAMLLTMGKDHRKRMAQLVAIAKGGAKTGMEQTFEGIVGSRKIIGCLYVPVASLAEQVMRLVERLTTVPPQVKQVFQQVLPPPGKAVPLTALVRVDGQKLVVDLDISAEVVGMIARSTMAALRPRQLGGP